MLALPDVQCVAICDVQASRREAGKTLVDQHYGNNGLRPLPRLPRAARPQGHRRRPDRHRRPLARPGVDPGGPGRQGRLQREALRPDHRRLPGAGRHHASAPAASSRPAPSGAACRISRRPSQLAHSGKLGKLHTLYASVYTPEARQHLAAGRADARAATWSTGTSGWARPRGGRTTRRTSTAAGAAITTSTPAPAARLGRAHRRPLPVGQQGRRHDAHRVRAVADQHHGPLRQRREAGARFPQDPVRRSPRLDHSTWAPARCGSSATRAGWRPATAARSRSNPASLQGELKRFSAKPTVGPRRVGPRPQLLRLRQVARRDGGQPAGHAALAHRLPRGGARLDSQPQAHARPGQGRVRRRRRGQRPARARAGPGRTCAFDTGTAALHVRHPQGPTMEPKTLECGGLIGHSKVRPRDGQCAVVFRVESRAAEPRDAPALFA